MLHEMNKTHVNLDKKWAARTSLMPGSTERHVIASAVCSAPGKASQTARARTNARVLALRIMIESNDGYS